MQGGGVPENESGELWIDSRVDAGEGDARDAPEVEEEEEGGGRIGGGARPAGSATFAN